MSKALEQQEIEKEKIERVIFFLRDLYLLTKDGYTTVKWTVLSDKHLTSPLVKQVLLARGTITKAATKNLFYWSSKNIPSWDMAESIYQSTQALIQKEKANKQIVDSFKKKTEGKLIPVVKMPQTIPEVFGLSKGENPVKTKLNKFSDERRIEAIRKILYYCATPRNSIELKAKLKEVTCGSPTLQWLKLNGWLLSTERGKWVNIGEMDPSRFDEACLNKLKADLKKGNIGSVVDVRKAANQESQNSKLVDLQKRLNENVLNALGNETGYAWRRYMCNNIKEHTYNEIFNWLVNNKYFLCTNLTPLLFQVNGLVPEISYEEVVRMNNDIKLGVDSTKVIKKQIEDFETINKDKSWPKITEKTSTLSSVDALKEERIKFAKMLFKLGDVKAANEILTKELE